MPGLGRYLLAIVSAVLTVSVPIVPVELSSPCGGTLATTTKRWCAGAAWLRRDDVSGHRSRAADVAIGQTTPVSAPTATSADRLLVRLSSSTASCSWSGLDGLVGRDRRLTAVSRDRATQASPLPGAQSKWCRVTNHSYLVHCDLTDDGGAERNSLQARSDGMGRPRSGQVTLRDVLEGAGVALMNHGRWGRRWFNTRQYRWVDQYRVREVEAGAPSGMRRRSRRVSETQGRAGHVGAMAEAAAYPDVSMVVSIRGTSPYRIAKTDRPDRGFWTIAPLTSPLRRWTAKGGFPRPSPRCRSGRDADPRCGSHAFGARGTCGWRWGTGGRRPGPAAAGVHRRRVPLVPRSWRGA